jgi:non-specific serine/threonine protein kinase
VALSGDIAQAKPLAIASVAVSSRAADPRIHGFCLMTLADCLIQEGNPAEAIEVLREALSAFEALPERWALLRAASLLAEACGTVGDWPRAAILLGVIDTLSERTGGRPYAHFQARLGELDSRVRDELGPALSAARQAGQVLGRGDQITPALWPAATRGPGPVAGRGLPLTRREREIADLIAAGLTNRKIAGRLFIAERTVDTHVGHILAKLGCATRAQVAALVTAAAAVTTATPSGDAGPEVGR